MIASTWPDQIKSKAGYTDDGPDPHGNRPDGASSSLNVGYSDHLHHKYWHFVDTPFTEDGTTLPAIPSPNAETQIATFRAVLGTSPAGDVKSYDLVWLLHLVGDVHQPLHSSTRVSATDTDGDSGGNNVKLCASPCRSELHGFLGRASRHRLRPERGRFLCQKPTCGRCDRGKRSGRCRLDQGKLRRREDFRLRDTHRRWRRAFYHHGGLPRRRPEIGQRACGPGRCEAGKPFERRTEVRVALCVVAGDLARGS